MQHCTANSITRLKSIFCRNCVLGLILFLAYICIKRYQLYYAQGPIFVWWMSRIKRSRQRFYLTNVINVSKKWKFVWNNDGWHWSEYLLFVKTDCSCMPYLLKPNSFCLWKWLWTASWKLQYSWFSFSLTLLALAVLQYLYVKSVWSQNFQKLNLYQINELV